MVLAADAVGQATKPKLDAQHQQTFVIGDQDAIKV